MQETNIIRGSHLNSDGSRREAAGPDHVEEWEVCGIAVNKGIPDIKMEGEDNKANFIAPRAPEVISNAFHN